MSVNEQLISVNESNLQSLCNIKMSINSIDNIENIMNEKIKLYTRDIDIMKTQLRDIISIYHKIHNNLQMSQK